MRNHRKFGRRFFDNYGGSTRHLDIQDEYGYTNARKYRNSDHADRNYWHNDDELYGDRDNYLSNYRTGPRKWFREGNYNPNLDEGYYRSKIRGYGGRDYRDYENEDYGRRHYYNPENYDRENWRSNRQSNRHNDYADLVYRGEHRARKRNGNHEHHNNERMFYREEESYPSTRNSRRRRNFSGLRHYNSEYYDRSFRKKPYFYDSWY